MDNQKLVFALGGVAALLAAVVVALLVMGGEPPKSDQGEDASGGAALELTVTDADQMTPGQELRCFVEGRFIGMATLEDCARRNGVDPNGGLDVGLDASGELTAVPFTPPPDLPALDMTADPAPAATDADAPAQTPSGARCMRYSGGEWRDVGAANLNACVQTLFSGRCEQLGGASYGRWGDTTLRLVPDRVEQSSDNANFRTLADQRRDCSIPEVR